MMVLIRLGLGKVNTTDPRKMGSLEGTSSGAGDGLRNTVVSSRSIFRVAPLQKPGIAQRGSRERHRPSASQSKICNVRVG